MKTLKIETYNTCSWTPSWRERVCGKVESKVEELTQKTFTMWKSWASRSLIYSDQCTKVTKVTKVTRNFIETSSRELHTRHTLYALTSLSILAYFVFLLLYSVYPALW